VNLRRTARIYFFNPFPLPVLVNVVRMAALRLVSLATSIVGETTDMVPEDPSDRIRNQMLRVVHDTRDVAVHLERG
jgi:hypothetical protein